MSELDDRRKKNKREIFDRAWEKSAPMTMHLGDADVVEGVRTLIDFAVGSRVLSEIIKICPFVRQLNTRGTLIYICADDPNNAEQQDAVRQIADICFGNQLTYKIES